MLPGTEEPRVPACCRRAVLLDVMLKAKPEAVVEVLCVTAMVGTLLAGVC